VICKFGEVDKRFWVKKHQKFKKSYKNPQNLLTGNSIYQTSSLSPQQTSISNFINHFTSEKFHMLLPECYVCIVRNKFSNLAAKNTTIIVIFLVRAISTFQYPFRCVVMQVSFIYRFILDILHESIWYEIIWMSHRVIKFYCLVPKINYGHTPMISGNVDLKVILCLIFI